MAYDLGWGTKSPGHIVYLVDLSGSMKTDNKIGQVMEALQKGLRLLLTKCTQGTAIMERFTASVIGYNSDIVPLFSGGANEVASLIRKAVSSGSPIFDYGEGGIAEPKWQTYMTNAFNEAYNDIEKWIREANGRPLPAPIVVNITDGQPEESNKSLETAASEAKQAAQRLMGLRTPDGNVLLFNLHIGKSDNITELLFPVNPPQSTGNENEDNRLRFLYDSSSVLPEKLTNIASSFELTARTGSRGMVSNVQDTSVMIRLIEFSSSLGAVSGATETPKP